jgi:hypothetical protein
MTKGFVPEVTIAQGAEAFSRDSRIDRLPGISTASWPHFLGMAPSAAQTSSHVSMDGRPLLGKTSVMVVEKVQKKSRVVIEMSV